ncbi:MAG TPA: UDP-N-acetylmuramate--L-alanine ligase, partial [Candidatus Limnocylindria bacterium]|nr:UDP-N-acetylmuramate--L-alanine ligase [Candidatus Limnocylindria bacterium]
VHDTFDPAHVLGADVVVRSSAYREDNPEVAAALAKGIPVWKRHDAWRFLAKGKRVIAVAGTHGKTTTTAMTWTALQQAGVDASLICGAALQHTRSNAHVGRGDVLVIEADEYDRVFHALEPTVAVVTNVDHDHVDLFPTREDYMEAFRVFVAGLPRGGTLVACADDPGAAALAGEARRRLAGRRVVSYGFRDDADVRARTIDTSERGLAISHGTVHVGIGLNVPGRHNALNALGAVAACVALGVDLRRAAPGLLGFMGTDRRLEELGSAGGVTVVDDYAHHPAEIVASIEATRWRGGRIVALFQPHTPSRLAAFFDEFAAALRQADEAVVAETFSSVREASAEGAKALAEAAGAAYARDAEEAARMLADRVRPGDTVLVLGAGDIRPAGERLLELLRAKVRA